jgi:HSP20 family molecular chaperone IbpA
MSDVLRLRSNILDLFDNLSIAPCTADFKISECGLPCGCAPPCTCRTATGPHVDLIEYPDNFTIICNAAGFHKPEVRVSYDEESRAIWIRGERKSHCEKKNNGNWLVRERMTSFSRRFQMPENIKGNNITATLDNGVLSIVTPKRDLSTPSISGARPTTCKPIPIH